MIPFNKPYLSGNETNYIYQAVQSGKISGNGLFTNKCHTFFQEKYGFKKCLLTSSCTDALEMAAILADIKQGDEVIVPSYTFVSTANAFVLRGAKIVFADSRIDHPGVDELSLESLVTERTKAIVPVHYAGVACDMDVIMTLATQRNIRVIEDAAQAIDNYYITKKNVKQPLGSIGHLSAFSFHETKNIISGEGGMLAVNDEHFVDRSEIIWEKGTNRSAFFRGEVDKYGWVDVGSSFLPSEIVAAFLYAQLENLQSIQSKRIEIWNKYSEGLKELESAGYMRLPLIPSHSTNNGHLFYILCNSLDDRTALTKFLKEKGILAVFHYQSLHSSPFYHQHHSGMALPNSDRYSDCLLRLPLFYGLTDSQIAYIIDSIKTFFRE